MNKRNLIVSLVMMTGLFAQSIVGTTNDVNQNPLIGANIVIDGTDLGTVSDKDGFFMMDMDSGTYTITASFIGYSSQSLKVVVGKEEVKVDFALAIDALTMSALEVLA